MLKYLVASEAGINVSIVIKKHLRYVPICVPPAEKRNDVNDRITNNIVVLFPAIVQSLLKPTP